ncbi:MAG: RNA methyltransferase [Acidobacteria bacterium]|nr:RNA methyltransferase [Acidobacteriota bacterium]
MMQSHPRHLRVVLVRPRNPLNIAAAARAMCNFGFQDLALVAPYEPVWQEARAAPGAGELLQKAQIFSSVLEAVDDCNLVLGTSSLSRRRPSLPVLHLDRLPGGLLDATPPDGPEDRWPEADWKEIQIRRIALLFGSEKTGLSNEDLSFCHFLLQIPTAMKCPSVNLAQAVAICCYEFRRISRQPIPPKAEFSVRATAGEVMRLVEAIEKLLGMPEALGAPKPNARRRNLRQMLLRWPLTSDDISLALGILRDLSWHLRHKRERSLEAGADQADHNSQE